MPSLLLETKFHTPVVRANDVERPRLLSALQTGVEEKRKLTLVSAPAGYGKTTLIAGWLRSFSNRNITWLSLDEGENELSRFLLYWLSAFKRVGALKEIPSPSLEHLSSGIPVMDVLINELSTQSKHMIFVLDDCHIISKPQIHEALEYFVEHQPANLHLIISTRQDPPLPLARMRARGQMTEIRAQDLRFTQEEAEQFFTQSMKLELPRETTTAVEERTEGWATGLQLAGLAIQNMANAHAFIETFRGSHRYVLDYLAEEVLRQQEENIRLFLTRTSILERFNADACSALTGQADSQSVISQLERSNLFIISLDDERRWYRYHHLFADYLKSLLTKAELSTLYKQAAIWHKDADLVFEAVHYAIASNDMDFSADMLDHALKISATWSGGYLTQLSSWLDVLPPSVFDHRPSLSLSASRIHYLTGHFEEAEELLIKAEEELEKMPVSNDRSQLLATASLYRGAIASARGDFRQAIERTTYALANIPNESYLVRARGYFSLGLAYDIADDPQQSIENYLLSSENAQKADVLFLVINALCNAAQIQINQGQLHIAEQTCQDAIRISNGARIPPLGLALSLLGEIALERKDFVTADQYLQDGIALSRYGGLTSDIVTGLTSLACLHVARGEKDDALILIQEITQLIESFGVQQEIRYAVARLAQLQHLLSLPPKADQAESESRTELNQPLPAPLSEQELRVLNLIVMGKSNKEIAEQLVITVGTAKWHVHNVLQKLGVGNRPQAIARARELGI